MKKIVEHLKQVSDLIGGKAKPRNRYERKSFDQWSTFVPDGQRNFDSSPQKYITNIIVYRCVNLIAQSASHVPWRVFSTDGATPKLRPDHPANRILKRPNYIRSRVDFFSGLITNLLLHGNSYVYTDVIDKPLTSARGISMLELIDPPSVHLEEKNGRPISYNFTRGDRKFSCRIDQISGQSQMLHISNYNPNNNTSGISSLKPCASAIKLYEKVLEWNMTLLNNSTKPSGILAFDDNHGSLTEEQFDRLKEQFYTNFSGSTNSGKPLILEGGIKWQTLETPSACEKFLDLKNSIAKDIAAAFNVPPQLLCITGDNTYNNMKEGRLALWEENILPLLVLISDKLSYWFSYWYDENLLIDFDRDNISALTEKRQNLWNKIKDANFMTINEKRAIAGLDPIDCGKQLEQ